MSAVIEFPVERVSTMRRAATGASAKVIIFPGIRVERSTFSLADRLEQVPQKAASRSYSREGDGA
jgi:hypothetical protein